MDAQYMCTYVLESLISDEPYVAVLDKNHFIMYTFSASLSLMHCSAS